MIVKSKFDAKKAATRITARILLREFAETDPVAYYNTGPVCPHCELTNNSSGEKIAHEPDTCLWLRARKFMEVK